MNMIVVLVLLVLVGGTFLIISRHRQKAQYDIVEEQGTQPRIATPRASVVPLFKLATPIGWKAGEMPIAAAGLKVQPFATGLDHPRWLLALPNGDVLVAETNAPPKPDDNKGFAGWVERKLQGEAGATGKSANRITLLRDTNGDGIADQRTVLLSGLNSPFGMALVGDQLYVADTDALLRFPFKVGETKITAKSQKVLDLPAGRINHHWTKNVVAAPDGSKLYVTIGSNSNVGERGQGVEQGRAAIWEVDPKTGDHRIYAYGLRNPNGMGWEPTTHTLWTVVNERDALGSDLVPDYLTNVQFGGFYGWPWFYWGTYPDSRPRDPAPELIEETSIRPDYAVGPHTASLGLAFATGARLGPAFAEGAFIGQHGSWNRDPLSGYKVIFVKFVMGQPVGKPVDVLAGFLDAKGRAHGRPVGVVVAKDGGLLVADDVGNSIWRVGLR
ncbi:MAG TPA: sorbosone dehydrogenase family protein [Sphingomonas sp.]|uniref:PQQ-dependent sugar dehydrogenase n=1 Tax=Sphingomonas sp. TaxID=28214 RepID=UPI002B74DE24|nr:sorbosone dehydrogenase family protein [Sphingomonas sp.]HMI19275.1 sorbosone dehydrogenase family protein [Sphingomonas sp.]